MDARINTMFCPYCDVMFAAARRRGQSPGEAELHYLENAKNMALYGVHMHEAVVRSLVYYYYLL